jgi:hypothetical protein
VAGFVALPNAVLLAPGLSRDAKLLYAVLLHYARQAGSCYPGRDRLQAALGCGHHQLAAYLRELEAAGLVARRRRGPGRTTLYTLRPLPVLGVSARSGGEASSSHARPAGTLRDLPTRPGDGGEAPPPASRAARNRPQDVPETGAMMGPKPAAEEDPGDEDAADQQQPPPSARPSGAGAEGSAGAVVALLMPFTELR